MGEFFILKQIFLGKLRQQISYDAVVMLTGGRADGENTSDIQKHYRNRRFGNDAHIQHRAGRAGKGGGINLPLPRF